MSLFNSIPEEPSQQPLAPGAVLLRAFALQNESAILEAVHGISAQAPFRHLITPGGFRMSVAMTNCGSLGWVSDRTGYRYSHIDPESGRPWPAMPPSFLELAQRAAASGGFPGFHPEACLVNCYEPGAKLSLHQDKDENNYDFPIVSVSLGAPATFLFGGLDRADKQMRISLLHGDVVVWGGPARLRHHGVLPLKENHHPAFGHSRVNLTFRKAG